MEHLIEHFLLLLSDYIKWDLRFFQL